MSTWYDLKLAVLQKMFAADDVIVTDESTLGYIAAMPHCANEGLAQLATAGKFITKTAKITQMDVKNLVTDELANTIHEFSDTYSYQTDEGQSYYFECAGIGTCDIEVDGGINAETSVDVREAGANILVAGSAVYGAADVAQAVKDIRGKEIVHHHHHHHDEEDDDEL